MTELVSMPTEQELHHVVDLITDDLASATVKISGEVRRIRKFGGKEAPTLEDIGRLYVYVQDTTEALKEVQGYVENVRRSLYDLDYVRIHDNVNPTHPTPLRKATWRTSAFGRGASHARRREGHH